MAQKTAWNAAALTEADINLYLAGEGGAWRVWTPTVTQSGAVAATVNRATFGRWGRMIVATGFLTVTGTGTSNNAVLISGLPAAAAYATGIVGTSALSDVSDTRTYVGVVALASTTTFNILGSPPGANTALGATGSPFVAALTSPDQISFTITYEAAS